MPVNMKGMQVQAGDHVSISNTRMGWTDKVFIVEEWSVAVRSEEGDPRIGVDLFLR